MSPQIYLYIIAACFLHTLNGIRPLYRPMVISGISFFMGWPTVEMALHHIAWQAALAAWVFHDGAEWHAWPVQAALGLTALNWAGLAYLAALGFVSRAVLRRQLAEQLDEPDLRLGPGPPAHTLVQPFPIFVPRGVERVGNIPFSETEDRTLKLDVYRPEGALTGCPVLLQLHGGGWIVGHRRQQARPMMHHLAKRGWVCVSASYRLSPRATFPEPLHDAKQALIWVKQHIQEYGGDPQQVVVTGNSAGSQLAALLALTPNNPELQPGFEAVDTSVRACVAIYAVFDLIDPDGLANPGLHWYLKHTLMKDLPEQAPELYRLASPIHHINEAAPPFLAVHGTHDTLVPVASARRFVKAFRELASAPLIYLELPGATHAFDIFHSARANATVAAITAWLERQRATW